MADSAQSLAVALGVCPLLRGLVSFSVRHRWSQSVRWCVGMSLILVDSVLLQRVLAPALKSVLPSRVEWAGMLVMAVMQYCNSVAGLFGGSLYYDRHGITDVRRALLASVMAGQVYFPSDQRGKRVSFWDPSKESVSFHWMAILKYSGCMVCGKVLFELGDSVLSGFPFHIPEHGPISDLSALQSEPSWLAWMLRLELSLIHFAVLTSVSSLLFSLLSFLVYLSPLLPSMQIREPYDCCSVLSSRDSLSFWRHWSRPVGEVLRYAWFRPFGGRNRPMLSTLAVFLSNALFHLNVSLFLVDSAMLSRWLLSFSMLACVIIVDMRIEQSPMMSDHWCTAPLRVLLMHSSLALSLYILRDTFNDSVSRRSLEMVYRMRFHDYI